MSATRRRQPARRRAATVALLVVLTAGTAGVARAAFSSVTTTTGSSLGAAATFRTYPQAVLLNTPTDYWRCDDAAGSSVAADASGNSHPGVYAGSSPWQAAGSPAGGSLTADRAFAFPGTRNAIAYSTATLTNPASLSLEVWVKTTTTVGGTIMTWHEAPFTSGLNDRTVYLGDAGQLYFSVLAPNLTRTTIVSAASGYNDGAWHHVVATIGIAGMRLYVDGGQVAANALVTQGLSYVGHFVLGGSDATSWTPMSTARFIDATLDEAAVYTSQLSAASVSSHNFLGRTTTIQANYNFGVASNSPWLFWHLNDAAPALPATTGTAADSGGGGRPGTYSGMTRSVLAGQAGALVGASASSPAVLFTGSSWAYYNTARAAPTVFSIEFWVKTSTTTGGLLVGMGNQRTTDSTTNDRLVYLGADGRIRFGVTTTAKQVITSPAAYADGAWHHVVAGAGAAGLQLFVDGTLVASNATPGTVGTYNGYWRWGGDTITGWTGAPGSYLTGYLDEVATYPSQLSAQQVAWHYFANH